MREDVKITKVYRFEELSEEAQQKVLEKLCDVNVDYPWWDCVYADAETAGVKIEEFDLDRGSYCRGRFLYDEWEVAANIIREHGKDCETYKDAYEFVWAFAIEEDAARNGLSNEDVADFELDDCDDLLDEFRQTIFEDYRSILQTEYDYLTSEEAIRETIDANDYEFTEDGRIY